MQQEVQIYSKIKQKYDIKLIEFQNSRKTTRSSTYWNIMDRKNIYKNEKID